MSLRNLWCSWKYLANFNSSVLPRKTQFINPSTFLRNCSSKVHIVQMRGLDYETKEGDVINFFKPLGITPIAVHLKSDASGRTAAVSEVEFSSHAEAVVAMRKKNAFLGNRFIRLTLKSNPDASQETKKVPEDEVRDTSVENEDKFHLSEQLEKYPFPTGHSILMKNAPPRMTDQAIYDFFSPVGVFPISVKPIYNESGIRTGEFHVQFLTKEDTFRAMVKNNACIGRNFVELSLGQN